MLTYHIIYYKSGVELHHLESKDLQMFNFLYEDRDLISIEDTCRYLKNPLIKLLIRYYKASNKYKYEKEDDKHELYFSFYDDDMFISITVINDEDNDELKNAYFNFMETIINIIKQNSQIVRRLFDESL